MKSAVGGSISVITPVRGAGRLPAPLFDVLDAEAILEIIVVGTDQPALDEGIDSDGRVRYIFSPEGGRGAQIAYGAAQARGDFIWIVHSDCRPTSAAIADISWILRDVTVSLGAFPLRFSEAHPLFRLYEALSRVDSVATTFGDQGFFCRRTDYIAVDGGAGLASV